MNWDQAPLYIKIGNNLKDEISRGVYKVGDFLPTEDELEKLFKASRTTVRNAIGLLEREGLVFKKQGKGTIVQEPKTAQNLNYITSFTETMQEKGIHLETAGLSVELVVPPPRVAAALNSKKGEKVFLIQRKRIADGVPVAFITNYLLSRIIPDLPEKIQSLREKGLYQLLEEEYGIRLEKAVETIEAYNSGPLEMELLQIPEETPLFHTVRITSLDDGTPFELVASIIRADKYEYRVYLQGRPPVT
ncbi:MAG: GntR family transcriptional regulator [Candidatus Atribacteria bacterium]|nr:GntR family transcriptional regulator [Candidatus Atribacteria bacterium]